MEIAFTLNGRREHVDVAPMTALSDVLRETLSLTGTKVACGEGFCGACTVHLDERPVVSCLVPAALVRGRRVTTVEGLADGPRLSALQQAMVDHDAVQCGMCFPGMLMSLTALLADHADHADGADGADGSEPLDEAGVRAALVGNVCRCTGYQAVVEAALAAAGVRAGTGA